MGAWFPRTKPVGEDLENWLEIAKLDTEVFIEALLDFVGEIVGISPYEEEADISPQG